MIRPYFALGLFGGVLAVFYIYWTWQGGFVGLVADDAIYLLMTDNFSPYYASINTAADFITSYTRFPPLYPLSMALLGGSSEHLIIAHLITTSYLLCAFVVYYYWLRLQSISILFACVLVLLFALLPSTLLFSINLWSEHLYLLLTLLVLLLVHQAKHDRDWLLIALMIGLVCLTRSIGIALLIASLFYAWRIKIPNFWLFAMVAILPAFAWWGVMQFHHAEESYSELLQMRYAEGVIQGLWWQLNHNANALWHAWGKSFSFQSVIDWRAVVLLVIAMMSVAIRVYQQKLDGFYIIIYMAIIGLWPNIDHSERFLFVVLPIIMAQIGIVIYQIAEKLKSKQLQWFYPLLLASLILPANKILIPRMWFADLPESLAGQQRTTAWLKQDSLTQALSNLTIFQSLQQGFKAIGPLIPKGECVYVIHPEWFMFHAKRLAFAPPFEYRSDALFASQMQTCGYSLIIWANTHPYFPSGYPAKRIAVAGHVVYEAPLLGQPNKIMVATLVRLD